jgi:hypothetical protein
MTRFLGLSQAAPSQPNAHQDADIGHPRRSARIPRLVDRQRSQPAWSLLYLASAQDGHIRGFRQRSTRSRPHLPTPENLRWKDKSASQDSADPDEQSHCMSIRSHMRNMLLMLVADLSNPKQRLSHCHGHHRRCPHLASNPRHGSSWLLARHESELDHFSSMPGICPGLPSARDLGAVLQLCVVRHRNLRQLPHQEEAIGCSEEEALRLGRQWRRLGFRWIDHRVPTDGI